MGPGGGRRPCRRWPRSGATTHSGLSCPWDVDETRLAVERGQTYLLWAEGADVVIDVFDAAGRLVGSTGDSSERGARVVWTAAEDGVYRATGRPWAPGSEGCGSTYVLRLQTDPPAAAVPEIPGLRARLRLPLIVHPSFAIKRRMRRRADKEKQQCKRGTLLFARYGIGLSARLWSAFHDGGESQSRDPTHH